VLALEDLEQVLDDAVVEVLAAAQATRGGVRAGERGVRRNGGPRAAYAVKRDEGAPRRGVGAHPR
jgi:hypothetical protein